MKVNVIHKIKETNIICFLKYNKQSFIINEYNRRIFIENYENFSVFLFK